MIQNIHQSFIQAVSSHEDKVALIFNGQNYTYKQLNERANEIANSLITKNLAKNSVVGVSVKRSFDLIASIIGILKAGHAYLPLDKEYPKERLEYMLSHSQACALVSDSECVLSHNEKINVDIFSGDKSEPAFQKGDLAYVIYTSGSTGLPKGVSLGHDALSNLLNWQKENSIGLKTLQFTPVSFDVHFQDIFSTLTQGGQLVLISEEDRLDFNKLLNILEDQKIERLFLPFVALNRLCEVAVRSEIFPQTLIDITTAGEQLRITDFIKTFFKNTHAKLHNHYGPSETHVVTSYTMSENVDQWQTLPPIGKAISNTGCHILDEDHNETNEGELYLSGICLAHGYINDLEKTNEKFININNIRMYKTGDLVKLNDQGEIEYLSRLDGQIKLRGYRIELGEIESKIETLTNNLESVVQVFRPKNSEPYLAAYICGEFSEKEVRQKLQSVLPDYMVPRFFTAVSSFPLTPSGKLDRKKLPAVEFKRPELDTIYESPQTEGEIKLSQIWKDLLGIKNIGINDKFFELGGTSLTAMSLLSELKKHTEKDLTIVDLFQYSTIKSQVSLIETKVQSKFKKTNKSKLKVQDVAVIAMTGRFPKANSISELWGLLKDGKEGIEFFSKDQAHVSVSDDLLKNSNYILATGEYANCDKFDASFFGMTPREAELMDPQQRKFLELSYEVLQLAGINPKDYNGDIGLFAGSANNTYQKNLLFHEDKVQRFGDFNVMLANEKDYLATRVAYKLGLTGPALSINTGCSTSLVALIQAVDSIRNGQSDIALAGGISINGQLKKGYLHQTDSIFSSDGHCKPYNKNATGTLFNDGAGIIVLKSLEQAKADNDNILAVIKGVGINNDGNDKMSFTAPSIDGQADAIIKAMNEANISPDQISYVEGHGTATPVGDPIEVTALTKAYKELGVTKTNIPLGSIKSNIGHLTAAAGIAGVIKTILAMRNGIIPKTVNNTDPINFSHSPFVAVQENLNLKNDLNFAAISSFGVGGTNAHIVLESKKTEEVYRRDTNELYVLSTKSEAALLQMQNEFNDSLHNLDSINLAYTLSKRENMSFKSFRTKDSKWSKTLKVNQAKKLCFMFPGQGAQYLSMGKELMDSYPEFNKIMNYCCDEISQYLDQDLRKVLFNEDLENGQNILNDTYYTQPAIFIYEYALARLLMSFGVKADLFIGHSIGELVAATVNGVVKLEDALALIAKRSNLMSKVEKGNMLTVFMPEDELRSKLPEDIQVAAVNGSQSTVVAGPVDSTIKFQEMMEAEGIAAKMLHTSHAFHSEMMRPMVSEFENFVNSIKLSLPAGKIYSTVTTKLEDELFTKPSYWAEHVLKPVLFAPTIKNLLDENTVFIEIGPRATLKTLATKEAGLNKIKINSLSVSDRTGKNEKDALLNAIGQLWQLGLIKNIGSILCHADMKIEPVLPYAFQGKSYWLDYPNQKNKEINNIIDEGKTTMSTNGKLREKIIEIFEEASGIDLNEYSDDTCFFEMGMDSLFLTQIALKLKTELKVEISFRQLTEEFADLQSLCTFYSDKVDIPNDEKPTLEAKIETTSSPEMNTTEQVLVQQTVAQQVQQPIAQPVMMQQQAPVTMNGIEGLLREQLALMQNQIALLSQGHISPSVQTSTTQVAVQQPVNQATTNVNAEKVVEKKEASKKAQNEESSKITADLSNAKKAFGAIARITAEKTINDEKAKDFIKSFSKEYTEKTKGSKSFTQENRKNHADPRAVTGFKPENKEIVYPIVVKKSEGQKLIDIDNNEYVDMLCGFGSNFFGNGNNLIKKYVNQQIDEGIEIGPQHPLTADVSKLINELTGNERTAFCNTGSEAVLGAMRIARTVSGQKTIISFSGSYHGINDEVIIRSSKKGKSFPAAPGINHNSVSNMIVLDYGTDESLEKIKELCATGEIAAVIVEPVQSRRSEFHPKDFLQSVRKVTEQNDVCLIFDEVITGFRIAPGGAQEFFNIRADLCTYGKIVGGGMPIGVVSGKAKYMDALDGGHWTYGDESIPTVGVTYFAGTFVRHPLALAAAKGALEIIKNGGKKQLDDLNAKAQAWVDDINLFCQQVDAPMRFSNFGTLMKPKWENGDFQYSDVFFAYMRHLGLHQYDGFPWFVNLAHTDQELLKAKEIVKKAIATLQMNGLMSGKAQAYAETEVMVQTNPPQSNAKLGKDSAGNPAWFIPAEGGGYTQLL